MPHSTARLSVAVSIVSFLIMMDNEVSGAHPCDRECEWPPVPRICHFDFKIQWYYTMSRACYNCPYNVSDCMLPHCIPADGVARPVISVNRQLHASIRVCHNDTVVVNVNNMLDNDEGVSLHWHGLYMDDTPYMDGVPMLTQCPIPAKTSFTYRFRANPPGTHWWHAHTGMQRADGLAGPFIIKRALQSDPHRDQYDIDSEDTVMFIADWGLDTTLKRFLFSHHSTGHEVGESMIVNGKGTSKKFTDPSTNDTLTIPRQVVLLQPNMRYRFRLISSAAAQCPFMVSVDNHNITIIASDGAELEPFLLSSLEIHSGERHDIVLTTSKPVSNYWMKFQGLGACHRQHHEVILRYTGAFDSYPNNSEPETYFVRHLNSAIAKDGNGQVLFSSLKPVYSGDYPSRTGYQGEPDQTLFLGLQMRSINNPSLYNPSLYPVEDFSGEPVTTSQINNVSFKFPASPLLTQPDHANDTENCDPESDDWSETRSRFCQNDYCECSYIVDVAIGSLVELVIYDIGDEGIAAHPMHLHGQHFAVVAMDRVGDRIAAHEMKEIYSNGSIRRDFDAVLKDSLVIPDGGYAVVRFLADNPGVWFFHCHQLFHSHIGMEMVFRVGTPDDWVEAPPDFPKCGSWPSNKKDPENMGSTLSSHSVMLFYQVVIALVFAR